jgi:hypothetical protein
LRTSPAGSKGAKEALGLTDGFIKANIYETE